MAVLLSGKPVAEHMCRDIRLRCEKLSRRGVTPTLGIVRVGRREEDIAYERGAIRRAESLKSPSGASCCPRTPHSRS